MLLLKLGANGHLWSVVVCVRMSLCMPRARARHKLSSKPWLLFPFLAPSRPQASPRDSPLFPGGLPGPLVEQWAPPPPLCRTSPLLPSWLGSRAIFLFFQNLLESRGRASPVATIPAARARCPVLTWEQ